MRRHHRRGYAVPMVLLLAMAGGAMVAVMLQRSGVSDLASVRQRVATQDHHLSLGVQEAAATWLGAIGNLDMSEMLDEDGLACRVELDGRRRIDVYFVDAQDSVCLDPSVYSPAELEVLERIRELLGTSGGSGDSSEMTRNSGPKGINVNSASERVLIAVASAVLEDASAGVRAAEALVRGRQNDPLRAGTARAALGTSGVPDAENVLDWLVYDSEIWRVRADVMVPPGPGRRPTLERRYTGIAVRGADANGASLPPQALFEEWAEVENP